MTKRKAYEWVKTQTGCNALSRNAFDNRVWPDAAPEAWRKAGRKSKGVSD